MDILEVYGRCSGQQINQSKTTIFFSKSTSDDIRNQIKLALGVSEIVQYERYLGLPSLVGRNKKSKLQLYKGMSLEKTTWLEGETPFIGWKGNLNQSSCPSYSYLHYELFQTSFGSLLRNGESNMKILVGSER